MSYKAAGVDLDAASNAKLLMASAVRRTHGAAVLAGMGAFGGAFDLQATLAQVADPVLVASTDGVGTKTLIAAALQKFDTVGQDLVNHCINDVLVQGARPLFCLDYIAAARIDPTLVATVVSGVAAACEAAGCALLGGETAEMPDVYAPGAFDLAGTLVGVVARDRLITGSGIGPGDAVLGLPSTGLHTNGYSLARRVCEPLGYATILPELDGLSVGAALLAVHRSYLPDVESLWTAGITIKGMAHITGGGLLDNVPRVLPEGHGVRLQRDSWPVPPICRLLVDRAQIDEAEAYRALNMGIGMVVIVAPDQAGRARDAVPDLLPIGEVCTGSGVRIV